MVVSILRHPIHIYSKYGMEQIRMKTEWIMVRIPSGFLKFLLARLYCLARLEQAFVVRDASLAPSYFLF